MNKLIEKLPVFLLTFSIYLQKFFPRNSQSLIIPILIEYIIQDQDLKILFKFIKKIHFLTNHLMFIILIFMVNIYPRVLKTLLEEIVFIKISSNRGFLHNLMKKILSKEEIHKLFRQFHKIFNFKILQKGTKQIQRKSHIHIFQSKN